MSEELKCQADDTVKGDVVSPSALQVDVGAEALKVALAIHENLTDHMNVCMKREQYASAEELRLMAHGVGVFLQQWRRRIEETVQAGDDPPLQAQHQPDIEKANDIMDEACLGEPWVKNGVDAALRVAIATALRAEREACARFVENWPHVHPNVSSSIAKAIRIGDTHD